MCQSSMQIQSPVSERARIQVNSTALEPLRRPQTGRCMVFVGEQTGVAVCSALGSAPRGLIDSRVLDETLGNELRELLSRIECASHRTTMNVSPRILGVCVGSGRCRAH